MRNVGLEQTMVSCNLLLHLNGPGSRLQNAQLENPPRLAPTRHTRQDAQMSNTVLAFDSQMQLA